MRSKRANEFAAGSEDKAELANWFRPSDVSVGPDGAIYVADWFDAGVGGHRMRDTLAAGTIYRIAPKGKKLNIPSPNLDSQEGQVACLKNPANNVRNIGFTRLKATGEKAVSAVTPLLEDANPYIQARALWLLAQLGKPGIAEVEAVLNNSSDAQMRIAAFRALRFVDSNTLERAAALATDPSSAVRREVALALRDTPLAECQQIILDLAKGYDGQDRWYLEALGTACAKKEEAIYPLLLKELGNSDSSQWEAPFAGIAWRLHPQASLEAFKARALNADLPLAQRKAAMTAIGFIPSKEAALSMVEVAENGLDDVRPLAAWWLYNRGSNSWSDYVDDMKGLNQKPNQLKPDQDYKAPIDGPEITQLDVKSILALEGNAARGKLTIARCYMCHQVDGTGVDFGPALDGWGKGNSREAITTAIVHPGEGIAHGFEASEIVTKKGHTLQGFILFGGGSYIMKVIGGGEVNVSRKDVKSVNVMERSLMMSASQLGLSTQDVADVVAYLKGS